jgi:hypothetical protein|tara:strand:- start:299 stop:958 length:660 start_codon:yes stop_codon:yes gene_type:complete
MGYYGQRYYSRAPQRPAQKDPELVGRIEKAAARGVSSLTDWERNFMGSLLDSAKKYGRLTAKQHDVFQRIEKKTDPEVQAARKTWNEAWDESKREATVFAANYYKANPPYFGEVAERILNDSSFIPSEKLYSKMVLNKYVQRAMTNARSVASYTVGSMVTVRDSNSIGGPIRPYRGKDAVVLEVGENLSATKGARTYKVLPVGAARAVATEERYLKKKR